MIPHRRREFAAGNHFSFSHPPRTPTAASSLDAMGEYNLWAERIKGANHGYFGRSPDPNPGAWARRPDRTRRGVGAAAAAVPEEEEFRWAGKESYDSDTPSPPLWRSSPIARSAESSPIRSIYHDDDRDRDRDGERGRNPNQRAQAIARYRQEMMDLVRGMPEAAYELSLRDIVESPRIVRIEGQRSTVKVESPEEKSEKGANQSEEENKKDKKKKKKRKVRKISRSESLDTGLLIKMFMPLSVGGRRKSFGASSAGTVARVSPKPTAAAAAAEEGNNKGEDWWNKNEFSEAGSSRTSSTSSSSSSGNSNSGARSRSRKMSSCYSFFRSHKSRTRRS